MCTHYNNKNYKNSGESGRNTFSSSKKFTVHKLIEVSVNPYTVIDLG